MENMRKRPGGDVTVDDASSSSSSSSAKRRRDQANEAISAPPAAIDVVMDSSDISVPPAVNDVVAESDDCSVTPAVGDVVVISGDVSVVNGVVSVPPAVNDVVVDSGDETISELARLLDLDYMSWNAATSPPARLTFSEHPERSPKVFQTMSTSYVTINGNEESCGSSFSDAESSVMASVDRAGRNLEQVRLDFEWYEAQRWAEGHGESGFDDRAWDAAGSESAREGMVLNLNLDPEWDEAALARFLGEDLNW